MQRVSQSVSQSKKMIARLLRQADIICDWFVVALCVDVIWLRQFHVLV